MNFPDKIKGLFKVFPDTLRLSKIPTPIIRRVGQRGGKVIRLKPPQNWNAYDFRKFF